jgi:glucose/arabinose dehydrogenase
VAESHRVIAYKYDADTYTASSGETLLSLPDDGGHNTRTLLLHPDGTRLLVSVGSSCNVCEENDPRRASILAVDLTTKEVTTFAKGLRNTVFMTIHPVTGETWGTDMGRDNLGDDIPPDEVNILRADGNYGWPTCYGKNIHDAEFDTKTYIRAPCSEPFETPSHIDIPAHSAPLGLAFIPEEGWPEKYWYDLLIAYHGSWNRSVPTGYKIIRIPLDAHGAPEGEPVDFMTGFMTGDGTVLGRPVDIQAEPGGILYITDDRAGVVYRITRTSL